MIVCFLFLPGYAYYVLINGEQSINRVIFYKGNYMNFNRITLALLSALFYVQIARTDVSFFKEEVSLQVKRVEKVMEQLAMRRKLLISAGITGGLFLVNYYRPGFLTSWIPKKLSISSPQVSLSLDKPLLFNGDYLKVSERIQINEDKLNEIYSFYQENKNKDLIPFKFLNLVKNSVPLVLASFLFPVIDRYVNYLRATCFPQVTLGWFVGMHTRYSHFLMILEEQAKLVSFEKDQTKHNLMVAQMHDALSSVVDHCASIIGYMAYQQRKSLQVNDSLAQAMNRIVDLATQELSLFCINMNQLFNSKNLIGIPGCIESFKDSFDSVRRNFVIYESEVQDPSMHEKLI